MAMNPYNLVRSFLHLFDPEIAHGIAIKFLKLNFTGGNGATDDPILPQTLWGLEFPNPIGLAAGFDKDAEVPDAMLRNGFGFVETGTVTPLPQLGNPRPRLFRLAADEAVINRLGFNSGGLDHYAKKLAARKGKGGIVGANIGKNKETEKAEIDYLIGVERVTPLANYVVVNISSPNTQGLRDLQARQSLEALLQASLKARDKHLTNARKTPPLLVKVAPDLSKDEVRDIAEVSLTTGIDGIIIGNTTLDRPDSLLSPEKIETGGLSGKPLMEKSTSCLAEFWRLTEGKLPLVGCGGVSSANDAYAKIRAGAALVQLYTALVFQGPRLPARIARELAALLKRDGFRNVADAVAADLR